MTDDEIKNHFIDRVKFRSYKDVQSMLANPLASRLHGVLSGDHSAQDNKTSSTTAATTNAREADGQSSRTQRAADWLSRRIGAASSGASRPPSS